MPDFAKKIIAYLTRPELDIKHQYTNIAIVSALIVQIPCIVASIIAGTGTWGVLSDVFLTIFLAFALWLVNIKPTSEYPIVMMVFLVDFLIMPVMYLSCGGRGTGMILWMLFGTVFASVLLTKKYSIITAIANIVVFITCLLVEYYNPSAITFLVKDEYEILDVAVGYTLVSFIIVCTFRFQAGLYEKQNQLLKDQEIKLKEINEILEESSQSKSEFLENISRDIRVPINTILGMNEMIMRDDSNPVVQSYAKDIDAAAHQLFDTVSDIYDYSNIESGALVINEDEYDVMTLVNECFNICSPRAFEKKLDFVIENTPSMPSRLKGDASRIKQIIMNLLSNAIKYTEAGSVKLVLDYETISDNRLMLRASIIDTGIGLINAHKEQLFGKAIKIDNKVHRRIEGTSLGLIIVKELAELMQGSIAVESELGVGSTFTVRLPQTIISETPCGSFNSVNQGDTPKKNTREESFTAEDANVLVVDDVRVNLNVVKLLLRDTKIKLDLAESGEEALEYMRRKHYDLVLMDHMMPEMDGIETLKAIRAMEDVENANVPIVALTANAVQGADKIYYEAGFCDYLTKPIKVAELEKSLVKYLPANLVKRD